MIRRIMLALALGAATTAAPAKEPARLEAGPLVVLEPWSRATPSAAKVGAGYLVVENRGTEPDRLLRAEAEICASAEVHQTVSESGVARMTPTDGVAVAPKGRLELKPGGYHLMLTGLKRPLKEGERFAATLVFERAGRVPVTFTVRGIGAGADAHHHH
ncbi:MAG TPA: copper chaperone PCu(A)C [Microvirga sp.]|nr:copper chaperone PCu(A)C [Microvirga sp.]